LPFRWGFREWIREKSDSEALTHGVKGGELFLQEAAALLNLNLIETTDLWSEMGVKGKLCRNVVAGE